MTEVQERTDDDKHCSYREQQAAELLHLFHVGSLALGKTGNWELGRIVVTVYAKFKTENQV